MKSLIKTFYLKVSPPVVTLVVVMLVCINSTFSQLPDCASGNVMYSLWNDSISSTSAGGNVFHTVEVRPVNYTTGAVGALMGATNYTISRVISGTTYYGSSTLGVDANRFYTNTTMSFSGGRKDFIAISTVAPIGTTIIGTTPNGSTADVPLTNGLNDFFFVKMAVAPVGGRGFAIGVHRDTTDAAFTAATCNPLVSFTTCGALNCSTIRLLGFLPVTPQTSKWKIYNGDIAFNSAGDLYYMSIGFERINGVSRYTNVQLFKINAADIPVVAGTGTIPMSFVADYTSIDSTILNGLAFDPLGNLFISTRKFSGNQNSPTPYVNQLYKSASAGTTTLIPGFGPHTAGLAASDLASCYFPLIVLDQNVLKLSSKYTSGNAELTWSVNDNNRVDYFEIQRGDDGENFETVGKVNVINNNGRAEQTYSYRDPQSGFGKPVFYRIREVMTSGGFRFYSNIAKVTFNSKLNLVIKPRPNPFTSYIDIDVQLKSNNIVYTRLMDQSGKVLYSQKFNGQAGNNKITLNNFGHIAPGVYIAELGVDDEIIREKIIKNH